MTKVVGKVTLHDGTQVEHGETVLLPIDRILPNLYNPNEMSDEEFSMLEDNVEQVGFLAPIIVTPDPNEPGIYIVVDGFHRLEQQRMAGAAEIPCVLASEEIFDEKTLMLQTVRLNKIRGKINSTKFNALIDLLVNKHEVPFDDLSNELGFTDDDEFDALVAQGRKEVPKEARKEYDKAVKNVSDVNALAKLIERLWLKYSSSIPANFFIIDYGNLRHLWVQMPADTMAVITDQFREIFASGYKVSSVLKILLEELNVPDFIEHFIDDERLEKIDEQEENLDSLLEP